MQLYCMRLDSLDDAGRSSPTVAGLVKKTMQTRIVGRDITGIAAFT
jgi:hypothetical protein